MKKLSLLFISILTINCASIITGFNQDFTITTQTDSVKIYINNIYKGIAPVTCNVSKNISEAPIKIVGIKKIDKKYKCVEVEPSRYFQPIYLLNIITPLLFGFIFDYDSGAIFYYDKIVELQI